MSFSDSFRIGPNASGASATVRQTPHPDADGIGVSNVTLPEQVNGGDTFTVEVDVTVSTPSFQVGYTAPDHCTISFYQQGFNMAVTGGFLSGGQEGTSTTCARAPSAIDASLGQEYTTSFPVEVTAPLEGGVQTVEIQVAGRDSGMVMDTVSSQITVEVENGDDNGDTGNGDDGNGGDNGGNGGDDEPCVGASDAFTRNECCPLNPSLTFRFPPRIGEEIDLERDAPNLCAATPVGLVVLALVVYLIVNLSPTRLIGDILG